jgi:hypothetical protein
MLGGEAVAFVLLALTIALAAVEFDGEFGVTGLPVECGSVRGLLDRGDLNAKTCTADLRSQVSLVGASLFGALVLGVLSPLIAMRLRTGGERPRRWHIVVSAAARFVIAIAIVALGRHKIWSVGG